MLLMPIFSLIPFVSGQSQNVIGCGGRVVTSSSSSEINIDYNKINIGLYTEHGSLKDTTDCAPSNGYFFIPIYDLAKYKIKVMSAPAAGIRFYFISINKKMFYFFI